MNITGTDFGFGRCFLPQVLLAAETMRSAFEAIQEIIPTYTTASLGMTTTMPQIDQTIRALKTVNNVAATIVGGAVLTAEYAAQAGADAYASTGVEAVKL